MHYRRIWQPGGRYFFTVVTRKRHPWFADPACVQLLRTAIRHVKHAHPFDIDAMVVLPDHLHCVWTLPEGDADYARRWRLIKTRVTQRLGGTSIWQPRYWEHLIRDDEDWQRHVDYIHYNPVKHGLVATPAQWRYSSLRRFVERGWCPPDWSGEVEVGQAGE